MLALAQKGIFVFEANVQWENPSVATCSVLTPTRNFSLTTKVLNLGVVIPPGLNMDTSEIWVCAQTGSEFSILDTKTFAVKEVVPMFTKIDGGHKFRHLQSLVIAERNYLVAADRYLVQKWEVHLRQKQEEFDCHQVCKSITGDNSKPCF